MSKKTAFNPLLFFGIGLLPAIAVCSTLESAAIFAAIMLIEVVITNFIISVSRKIILENVRLPIYVLIQVAVIYVIDSCCALFPSIYDLTHFTTSLLFVNVLTIFIAEYNKNNKSIGSSIGISAILAFKQAVLLVVIGLLREILSFGKIWNVHLIDISLPFFGTAAGTVLIITIMAMIYNVIVTVINKNNSIFETLVERYTLLLENSYFNDIKKGDK